jgi:aminomethyltransferase
LRQLPLHDLHKEHGAKFGPFAGWEMPLFYPAGVLKEHLHTRAVAGLFDISHMHHVEVAGPQAAALVSRLCPYDAAAQLEGAARYTFFLNDRAGIIDDLIVTRLGAERFLIVCNAGCADKDMAHMQRHAAGFDCSVTHLPRAFLALQGPAAARVLAERWCDMGAMAFLEAAEPQPGWFVSRSGYTGEDGFEIGVPADEAVSLARSLLADPDVLPVGLGARDSLRMEAGLPLYGQDLSDDITPMEAGLAWAIPKTHREGGDFNGATALAAAFEAGPTRRRAGFRPQGGVPVRAHSPIFDGKGNPAGEVTSGGFGPSAGGPVALGLVRKDAEGPFEAEVRGKRVMLEEAKLPFVPHRYARKS